MAQTKIYPATQQQAQTIINKIDAVDAKIVTPTYQAKIVTPTTSQQLIEPDSGYTALSSVTVNPANTTDLDNWISRNDQQEPIYLELTTEQIAPYACYQQTRLVSFKGDNVISIGTNAFQQCGSLQVVDMRNLESIGQFAFQACSSLIKIDIRKVSFVPQETFRSNTSLLYVDARNLDTIAANAFRDCNNLHFIDFTARSAPPYLSGTYDIPTATNCKFIFADDSIKAAVQSASNWSNHSAQIKTIAEIEAEVGMSYDEYYLQCFGHPRFDN